MKINELDKNLQVILSYGKRAIKVLDTGEIISPSHYPEFIGSKFPSMSMKQFLFIVQESDIALTAIKPEMTIQDELEKNMLEMGIKFNNKDCTYYLNSDDWRLDEIANEILWHRDEQQENAIPTEKIISYLRKKISTNQHELCIKTRELIKYDSKCNKDFESLLHHISGDKYHPLYPTIVENMIWTFKRRLFNLPTYYPILINFHGPGGIGKTQFVRNMFSVIPEGLWSIVQNAEPLLNDDRYKFYFTDYYILVLSELGGLDKADVNMFKSIIDDDHVPYRMMGTTQAFKARNKATMVGTSNTKLKDILHSENDVRKWAEIEFHAYKTKEDIQNKMIEPLKKWDWLSLYRSVNERDVSPFHNHEILGSYEIWTEKVCRSITQNGEYFNELVIDYQNKERLIRKSEIWSKYKSNEDIDQKIKFKTKPKLWEYLEKQGINVNARDSEGQRCIKIPDISECKLCGDSDINEYKENHPENQFIEDEDKNWINKI